MAMKLDKKQPDAEIPTSSMADIAFLLIIFFMVTAVFASTKGLEFKLPKNEEEQAAKEDEAVFIKIEPDSSISVDCTPMDPSEILGYLDPKLSRNPEKPVVIYSDPYAPYSAMISVYDVLVSAEAEENKGKYGFAKVKNISVPTQSEIANYITIFGFNPFESRCQ